MEYLTIEVADKNLALTGRTACCAYIESRLRHERFSPGHIRKRGESSRHQDLASVLELVIENREALAVVAAAVYGFFLRFPKIRLTIRTRAGHEITLEFSPKEKIAAILDDLIG